MEAGQRIVFVEFTDGHPFTVFTSDKDFRYRYEYDFEHSKAYGIFYHWAGGGPNDTPLRAAYPYWAAEGFAVEDGDKAYRLTELPTGYHLDSLDKDIFDNPEICEYGCGGIYCEKCKDYYPAQYESVCQHIWWCGRKEDWSVPGERCKHPRPVCEKY